MFRTTRIVPKLQGLQVLRCSFTRSWSGLPRGRVSRAQSRVQGLQTTSTTLPFTKSSFSSSSMAQFIPDEAAFANLKGKTVVLTGAATGIGAATAKLLVKSGANVFFGDIATEPAEALVASLSTNNDTGTQQQHGNGNENGTITFQHCDVTKYSDIYNLFKAARDKFGPIHHAVSSAGIFEQGAWFDPALTIDSVGEVGPATTAVLDVNVLGSANFARIGVVFLREGIAKKGEGEDQEGENRSLTLLSSVNAFRESPGLYMYQTSKHAIQGLMRSMRKIIYERDGVRVNCVCPGVTDTPMTVGIADKFKKLGLYVQSAESVGRIILGIQCAEGMNGKAFYIEGGDGWEFEDGFYREQPRWLGEEATRRMRVNSEAVQKGALIKD